MNYGTKLFHFLYTIASWLPLLSYFVFMSFVLTAYIKLGKLPSYANPDPRQLELNDYYMFVFKGFDIGIIFTVIWIILSIITLFTNFYKPQKSQLIIGISGVCLLLISFFIDPLGLIEWFFD